TRVYQRLLAMDHEEALEFVEEQLRDRSLEDVYDEILLPALAMAEQDRHRGLLDERRQLFIRASMRDIIEELGDQALVSRERAAAQQVERLARGEEDAQGTTTAGNGNGKAPAAGATSECSATR